MTLQLTTNQVWEAIKKESFAVIGMVTANSEARARAPVNGKSRTHQNTEKHRLETPQISVGPWREFEKNSQDHRIPGRHGLLTLQAIHEINTLNNTFGV